MHMPPPPTQAELPTWLRFAGACAISGTIRAACAAAAAAAALSWRDRSAAPAASPDQDMELSIAAGYLYDWG
jgi:hypothetical protein